ncbi:MAG: hypothetical protein IJ730_07995 [Alphaproteobacteria bacterium]|nr:hypothetical protein [Alphaproteobacteria bacterium]
MRKFIFICSFVLIYTTSFSSEHYLPSSSKTYCIFSEVEAPKSELKELETIDGIEGSELKSETIEQLQREAQNLSNEGKVNEAIQKFEAAFCGNPYLYEKVKNLQQLEDEKNV